MSDTRELTRERLRGALIDWRLNHSLADYGSLEMLAAAAERLLAEVTCDEAADAAMPSPWTLNRAHVAPSATWREGYAAGRAGDADDDEE